MYYIYLQEYTDGSTSYFYVGKHKWEGEGLDPSYHGSSQVAINNGFIPGSTQLLEVTTSENHNERETYWIKYYASLFGVSPIVPSHRDGKVNYFVSDHQRFDGTLINAHPGAAPFFDSGLWCIDDDSELYTLSQISQILGYKSKTNSSVAGAWGRLGHPSQFVCRRHWIHRPGDVRDPNAPEAAHDDRLSTYSDSSLKKMQEGLRRFYATEEGKEVHKRLMAACHTTESHSKMSATKRSKRPRYRLQDGFEGDYVEIAEHINYTGTDFQRVSAMLRGAYKISSKWSVLEGAVSL